MEYRVIIEYDRTLKHVESTYGEEATFSFGNIDDAAAFMDLASKHILNLKGAKLEMIIPEEEVF